MSRSTMWFAIVALSFGGSASLEAQDTPAEIPEAQRATRPPRQHLAGPRFGFTAFTGDVAKLRSSVDLEPVMMQFGWQWETQIVSSDGGTQALLEWVALAGGLEQSELNLSLSFLAGLRFDSGVKFGVGPNINFNPDNDKPTQSMIVAVGATMPVGNLYLPINLAVGIAEGGPRFTALMGWIIGS